MQKISPIHAFTRYCQLKPILIVPKNINPEGPMGGTPSIYTPDNLYCMTNRKECRKSWARMLNRFKYYNCNDETGHTLAFYM